jgi:hypothetical protein
VKIANKKQPTLMNAFVLTTFGSANHSHRLLRGDRHRYRLSDILQKSEVRSVSYDSSSRVFTLQISTGMKRARIVVFAVGAVLKTALPTDCPFCGLEEQGSVVAGFAKAPFPVNQIYSPHVTDKIRKGQTPSIAIIGGGLTSAQFAHI